jgi:hypothetical protein
MALSITVNKLNAKCEGQCKGSATVTASGGAIPYTFTWNDAFIGPTRTGLCPDSYSVTVVDTFGVSDTINFDITTNPQLVLTVSQVGATSLSANVSGGVGPYTYVWRTTPTQYTQVATGLTPGAQYKVQITDSKGCSKTSPYITVTQ